MPGYFSPGSVCSARGPSCLASAVGSASCSPRNARNVDLLVAALPLCQQTASAAAACGAAASVAGADAVRRHVVGAASALNEPAESLTCAS